jgi:hypothetical protein
VKRQGLFSQVNTDMGSEPNAKVKRQKVKMGQDLFLLFPFYFALASEPISVGICGAERKETTG